MGVKGYKVFNPDWTCRGFQYEVGKTYKHEGNIMMCGAGFHFCQNISDCFNYYEFDINNKVAEVEAIGFTDTQNDKSVTNEIKIIRELTWQEVLDLANTGRFNNGYSNSGNHNNGNQNSNDWNNGNWNSGCWNNGDYNSGRANSGNHNSGDWNNGNWNSGDWNSTNYSAGFFNSLEQPLYIFNKPADINRDDFYNLLAVRAMVLNFNNNVWVYSDQMTEEEKKEHPEYEALGGYLKIVDYKTACGLMWESMTDDERAAVKDIPNFDAIIFEEITGINVNEGEN